MFKLHILCVVAVCLSGCSNKDSQVSFEIDVMAWNEQVEKVKAKIEKAATDNDPLAHRSNEDEAKRLEVELENYRNGIVHWRRNEKENYD